MMEAKELDGLELLAIAANGAKPVPEDMGHVARFQRAFTPVVVLRLIDSHRRFEELYAISFKAAKELKEELAVAEARIKELGGGA